MIIKVPVDRAECLRQGIDYDSDFLEVDIGPADAYYEEREWIGKRLRNGVFDPKFGYKSSICPPSKAEFLRVVRVLMRGERPYGESADEGVEAP